MGIHVDKKVNDEFDVCLNNIYGGYGNVKTMHRHVHNYLRMTFYFSDKYKLKIDMINYMNATVDDLLIKFNPNDTRTDPATEHLFLVGNSENMIKYKAQEFHIFLQKNYLKFNNGPTKEMITDFMSNTIQVKRFQFSGN